MGSLPGAENLIFGTWNLFWFLEFVLVFGIWSLEFVLAFGTFLDKQKSTEIKNIIQRQ
jgi:hypothetical protein